MGEAPADLPVFTTVYIGSSMRVPASYLIRLSTLAVAAGLCPLAMAAGTSGVPDDGSFAARSTAHASSIQHVALAITPAAVFGSESVGAVRQGAPTFLMPHPRKLAHRLSQLEGELVVLRRLSAQDGDSVAALSRRNTVDAEFLHHVEAWLVAATFLLLAVVMGWSAALRRR